MIIWGVKRIFIGVILLSISFKDVFIPANSIASIRIGLDYVNNTRFIVIFDLTGSRFDYNSKNIDSDWDLIINHLLSGKGMLKL